MTIASFDNILLQTRFKIEFQSDKHSKEINSNKNKEKPLPS